FDTVGEFSLREDRIHALDGVGAIEFRPHGGYRLPGVELLLPGPEMEVVDEMGQRVADAGVQHELTVHNQAARPRRAGKVARRARPPGVEADAPHAAELAAQNPPLQR